MGMERVATASRRRDTRSALPLLLATATLLLAPATALAGSAVQEYSLDLPDAKGKVENPARTPQSRPEVLGSGVTRQLQASPYGNALAAIATAGELGAPGSPARGSLAAAGSGGAADVGGSEPSALSAAAGTVGDPAILAVIAGALVLGALLLGTRRRGGAPAP